MKYTGFHKNDGLEFRAYRALGLRVQNKAIWKRNHNDNVKFRGL